MHVPHNCNKYCTGVSASCMGASAGRWCVLEGEGFACYSVRVRAHHVRAHHRACETVAGAGWCGRAGVGESGFHW
jgi:hypothetical protein